MANRNDIALLITKTIEEYAKISIINKGNELEISDRTGTFRVPFGSSKAGSTSVSTFR